MHNRKNAWYVIYLIVGLTLFVLGCAEIVDSFWCGMGSGLLVIGLLRLLQLRRLRKDETYREKVEVETKDERNQFIRSKAWTWAGYLFIIIVGFAAIILRVLGQEQLSIAASYGVCLLVILYWVSFFILRKKY